jgi:hypothetical protein
MANRMDRAKVSSIACNCCLICTRLHYRYDRVQAKISDMAARNDQLDMKRIAKDLKAIKAENEELQVKYTAAKAAKKAGK